MKDKTSFLVSTFILFRTSELKKKKQNIEKNQNQNQRERDEILTRLRSISSLSNRPPSCDHGRSRVLHPMPRGLDASICLVSSYSCLIYTAAAMLQYLVAHCEGSVQTTSFAL
jgi:hypothetical protein